jgi:hypothetical protein
MPLAGSACTAWGEGAAHLYAYRRISGNGPGKLRFKFSRVPRPRKYELSLPVPLGLERVRSLSHNRYRLPGRALLSESGFCLCSTLAERHAVALPGLSLGPM